MPQHDMGFNTPRAIEAAQNQDWSGRSNKVKRDKQGNQKDAEMKKKKIHSYLLPKVKNILWVEPRVEDLRQ